MPSAERAEQLSHPGVARRPVRPEPLSPSPLDRSSRRGPLRWKGTGPTPV